MKEWCFAHPWMTFFICICMCQAIGDGLIRIKITKKDKTE